MEEVKVTPSIDSVSMSWKRPKNDLYDPSGYIVDYKDLFKKVENAIAVYTSELDHSAGGPDPEVLLQDRLKTGKERLDNALEAGLVAFGPMML